MLAPLEFYVAGGDDRRGPFYLDVVDSPTISSMTLRCTYPAYTRRAARDIGVSGLMQLARGTEVTILATANKPLLDVQVDEVSDDPDAVIERLVGELLTSGAEAARAAKRLVLAPAELDELIQLAARIRTGEEGQEGLRAFLEKREAAGGWGVYARKP